MSENSIIYLKQRYIENTVWNKSNREKNLNMEIYANRDCVIRKLTEIINVMNKNIIEKHFELSVVNGVKIYGK